ncbi:hypothetical protein [Streptomyces scabiei]|uniref:hypothetical protein n=1 Tax=Streptomyces scabiei TaxID=1930 RepID=UPI0029B55A29|nr:hypothetical protein [Streptomyces scabiei]MDX3208457.1 hypothetical protein [Streptomyces scabiei]
MTDQVDPWDDPDHPWNKTNPEPEPPCGGCTDCQQARPMFDLVLDGADRLWQRYQDPAQFSFTANGSGLHRTTCRYIRLLMPTEHTRPEGEAYDLALQQWGHGSHDFYSNQAEERYSSHMRLDIMTPSEAREWIVENIGTRGGQNFNLCKVCRPEVPSAP